MVDVSVEFTPNMDKEYNDLMQRAQQDKKDGKSNSKDIQLLKAVDRTIGNLKVDPQYGTHIKKINIPKMILDDYGVEDLWKVDLPGYWRLLYSNTRGELKVICIILDVLDHDSYNKVFRYKKR